MLVISRIRGVLSKLNLRVIKVTVFGNDDHREPYNVSPWGIDSNPIVDTKAIYSNTSNADEPVCLGVLYSKKDSQTGETYLYSTNSAGVVQFEIKLKNDGTCVIGSGADYAVRFDELKAGFDQLKQDFNSFLTHVHGAAGTPPTPPATPSTASVDGAKVDEVRIGGGGV